MVREGLSELKCKREDQEGATIAVRGVWTGVMAAEVGIRGQFQALLGRASCRDLLAGGQGVGKQESQDDLEGSSNWTDGGAIC